MNISVAKSLGLYELAQNPYHVDVFYPQACSEAINDLPVFYAECGKKCNIFIFCWPY